MNSARAFAWALSLLVVFCALASGAHDLWAATLAHLAALGLLASMLFKRCWGEDAPGLSPKTLLAAAIVLGALTLSFLQSVHPEESRLALWDWAAAVAVFLTALHLFAEERPLRDILSIAAPLAVLECAVILYQHGVFAQKPDVPQGLKPLFFYVISLQVPGTLVNSSVATAFLLLWTPVFVSQALQERAKDGRWPRLWTAAGLGAVWGILALNSNWGLVCLAAGAPLMAGPRPVFDWIRLRPRLAAASSVTALLALGALLAWKFGHAHNMNAHPLPPGETTRRLYWWASGLKMFLDHPWLGVGLGNFPSAYLAYKVGNVQNTLYPHNVIVELLAETGILTSACLAAVLLWGLSKLSGAWKAVEPRWPFLLGLLMFALFGTVGLSIEYLVNLLVCGLFLGIAAAPAVKTLWRPRRSVLVVFAALCVFSLPFQIAPFLADRTCVDARGLLQAGDAASATRRFASAAKLDPLSCEARRGLAQALYRLHLLSGRAQDLEAAVAQQKKAIQLNRLQGSLRYELGGYQAASKKRPAP